MTVSKLTRFADPLLDRQIYALCQEINNISAGANAVYTVNYDDVGSNISYLGEAAPGAATSAAVWRVRKLDTSAGDLVTKWADGNDNFDNIWDNRTSLTYS